MKIPYITPGLSCICGTLSYGRKLI